MPGWLKALLVVVALIVILIVAAVIGGAYWWSHNKDALFAKGKATIEEGREFGRKSDNQGCVDETMSRYRNDRGFTAALTSGMFETACLSASKPTPGFCDDVPRQSEFMKSGQWRVEQCRKVGMDGDKYCQQLFAPVQQYCEIKSRTMSEDSDTNSNRPSQ